MSRSARVALLLFASILMLLALEGAASVLMGGVRVLEAVRTAAERNPTHYDPELGWTNKPDVHDPDFFGPDVGLRTNSIGARSDRPTSPAVPEGRVRIVCSGDSFTFGYRLSNESTWCHVLEQLDSRITSVNLGVNGYGLDQAYLRYRRDLAEIAHDVHVFAFIADDFRRMRPGAYRPWLVMEGGRLAIRGVPAQRPSSAQVLVHHLRTAAVVNFRSPELVRWMFPSVREQPCEWYGEGGGEESDPLRPLVEKLFEEVRDMTSARGSVLVLTYLPCVNEYGPAESPRWRARAREIAARLDIPFVDLVPDLNRLPRETAESLFTGGLSAEGLEAGQGHYTVSGNAFIARALLRRLSGIEAVTAKLDRTAGADR